MSQLSQGFWIKRSNSYSLLHLPSSTILCRRYIMYYESGERIFVLSSSFPLFRPNIRYYYFIHALCFGLHLHCSPNHTHLLKSPKHCAVHWKTAWVVYRITSLLHASLSSVTAPPWIGTYLLDTGIFTGQIVNTYTSRVHLLGTHTNRVCFHWNTAWFIIGT